MWYNLGGLYAFGAGISGARVEEEVIWNNLQG
jgi:hypothetical protein